MLSMKYYSCSEAEQASTIPRQHGTEQWMAMEDIADRRKLFCSSTLFQYTK